MTVKGILSMLLIDLLLPAAIVVNIYLYFYPVLYSCEFPRPSVDRPADFRLLTLADPQIEGGNKLRKYIRPEQRLEELSFSERIIYELKGVDNLIRKYGKILDLWGNDYYLAHVYKTVKRHTYPTHVTVLGDLVGSQWITDEEFQARGHRFWSKIFADAEKVTVEDIVAGHADGEGWTNKLIMIPGNHDVGYAGDISRPKLERFERMFGPFNYGLAFHPPENASFAVPDPAPELRIMVLNSLTLDSPILDQSLADDSFGFVDKMLKNKSLSPTQATVLLTHLPFHKPEGICVDGPSITYFAPENGAGIKSQNFLSDVVSNLLKGWIFGFPSGDDDATKRKSRGVVLTGHDHEGCNTVHFWDESVAPGKERPMWNVTRLENWPKEKQSRSLESKGAPIESIREITVRSMMGEFGGNAGLLSAWFEWETLEWKFEYSFCALGVQHLWWATHVINAITGLWIVVVGLFYIVEMAIGTPEERAKMNKKMEQKKKN